MEIKLSELKSALECAKHAIAAREIVESTTCYSFMDDKIITFNTELAVIYPIKTGLIGSVNAAMLLQMTKKMKNEIVHLSQDDNEIMMRNGRGKYGFTYDANVIDFIKDSQIEQAEWHTLPENFVPFANLAKTCCSSNTSLPKFMCVNLAKNKMEATDNAGAIQLGLENEIGIENTLIFAKYLNIALKINPTEIAKIGNWVHFRNEEGVIVSCAAFDEDFVDFSNVLSGFKKEKKILFTNTNETKAMLEKAVSFINEKIKWEASELCVFDITKNKLTLKAAMDSAWYTESVKIKTNLLKPISFSGSPKVFLNAINNVASCYLFRNFIYFKAANWIYFTKIIK